MRIKDLKIGNAWLYGLLLVAYGLLSAECQVFAAPVTSPNGKLSVTMLANGLKVSYSGRLALEIPQVGLEGYSVSSDLAFQREVVADYEMLAGKRHHCTNKANEYVCTLQSQKTDDAGSGNGAECKMVVRLYNDGIALRYEMPSQLKEKGVKMPAELTTYRIPEGTNRWMQQWTDSYEGFFPRSSTAKVRAQRSFSGVTVSAAGYNCRWGYPSLVEVGMGSNECWLLLTEANVERGQSASCLYNRDDVELFRVVPDKSEGGASHTPWRVVVIGELADVVQSTLVTDVSEPNKLDNSSWVKPGVVSWVYWAYNHGSNDYNIIKKYVDMAATLHLPYVLIDAEWDEMKDGKTVEDAIQYAKSRGVKPMIWYNSSVGWVDGAPGPKYRLNKEEDREREFAWCEKLGVAGVKIDFFSGDTQLNMDYCHDLMESAARHHLLVNFHGATIPRGWQRTYPNLLTTEAVYGAEWYNNVGTFTDKAAAHNATLPFTRNVIGPMDYTPCTFSDSQHPHITTNAHELALTVLFESGLLHLADRPESYYAQPKQVQRFLSTLPAAWDDTRFVSGYPAESVVIARRSGNKWYVAGINGTDHSQALNLNWGFLNGKVSSITLFADDLASSQPPPNTKWAISTNRDLPASIQCMARGGFVMMIETRN